MSEDQVRSEVRQHYAKVAAGGGGCCVGGGCAVASPEASARIGYSSDEINAVPEGANLGLGCGNPQAIARLQPGEIVLDLGSGGGFDCFLAARQVGAQGRVIGVDMTAEMISRARGNADKLKLSNVEFRLGEIEHLPVADATVDVVISNCVINLSPDKRTVFREALRTLRPGGRLAISDVVATSALTEEERGNLALYTGCVAGAASIAEVQDMLRSAGFVDIQVEVIEASREVIRDWVAGDGVGAKVASATIEARRPESKQAA
jgi:arsenite methyltransferase